MFKFIATSVLLALGAVHMQVAATPVAPPLPCVILPPGDYTITSVTSSSQLQGNTSPGTPIFTETAAPVGQLGTWSIVNADQGGYRLLNVGLNGNVTTVFLRESQLLLATVATAGTDALTFSIECAGGDQYVIKAPDADQLWTIIPGESSSQPGFASIQLLPAQGLRSQLYLFEAVA